VAGATSHHIFMGYGHLLQGKCDCPAYHEVMWINWAIGLQKFYMLNWIEYQML